MIDHSDTPVPAETARSHAELFAAWVGTLDGFAGQRVRAKTMAGLYAKRFCPEHGLRAFPWQTLAAELGAVIPRKHHPVPGKSDHKLTCYLVPDLRADVIDLAARRRVIVDGEARVSGATRAPGIDQPSDLHGATADSRAPGAGQR